MNTVDYVGRCRIKWPFENDAAVRDLLKDCQLVIASNWSNGPSYNYYEAYATLTEEDLIIMRLGNLYSVIYRLYGTPEHVI